MDSRPVDIWTIHLDLPRQVVLSPDEQIRAARFRFEADRIHWAHARSALRSILALYRNQHPEEIHFSYGEHGKPAVEGVEFNLSHARNMAMIAVSLDVPVGVDIEAIREKVEIGKLLERVGETEISGSTGHLFQLWSRREARTKARGSSLMEMPPANVCPADLQVPPGFAAAVALVSYIPVPRYCGGLE